MLDTEDNEGALAKSRNNNNGEGVQAERLLPNGDFYTGLLSDNLPHGTGKYLWTDGYMYEGDWFEGRTTGKGKFSWPSGATYEGDFKNGYMDGFGTYTGTNGDTYRGLWAMNLKHGFGQKWYANGDYYEGPWKSGLQDGHGRYVWRDGKEYNGEWKSGVIWGRGTLILDDGNRYEGNWEDGLPKGYGIFTWVDESSYIGTWSKDPKEQRGVFYPSPTNTDSRNSGWNQHDAYSIILNDCMIFPEEDVSILPSQKTLNWSGIKADFLQKQAVWKSAKYGSSGGGRSKKSLHRACSWQSGRDGVSDTGDVHQVWVPMTPNKAGGEDAFDVYLGGALKQPMSRKKQGVTISKGQKNYELMLNLQLGIRHSVGKPAPTPTHDLRSSAFDPKEKVWTRFPTEGSKYTPPHQSIEFRWKDYCPLVFRYLRNLFKIDAADYMISICGNDALRELSSPGKSGSFFYMTHDDRYMIKTVKKAEVKALLRMLQSYYNHVRAYENTLVTKFFGLHCVKLAGATQKKVRFVIMGNLFCSKYNIHRIFDLKGSSHGRTTSKLESEIDETTTLKDLDLNYIFRLQKAWFQELCRQVERDCDFLEAERIMDYSLLVGIHFTDVSCPRDSLLSDGSDDFDQGGGRLSRVEARDMDQFLLDPNWWSSIRLGVNMPARVEKTVRGSDCENQLVGEPTGEMDDVILFFGIIDILQDYDITKKLENAYKSIQYDPTTISAVDPRQYAKRFRDFMYRIFFEDI